MMKRKSRCSVIRTAVALVPSSPVREPFHNPLYLRPTDEVDCDHIVHKPNLKSLTNPLALRWVTTGDILGNSDGEQKKIFLKFQKRGKLLQ